MKRTRMVAFATGWLLIFLSLKLPAVLDRSDSNAAAIQTWRFWGRQALLTPMNILGFRGLHQVAGGALALPFLVASVVLVWSIPAAALSVRKNRPVGPRALPLLLLLVWIDRLIGPERRSLATGYYLLAAGFTVITAALMLPDSGRDTPERRGFAVAPMVPDEEEASERLE